MGSNLLEVRPHSKGGQVINLNSMFANDLSMIMQEVGSKVVYGPFQTEGILNNEGTEVLQLGSKQFSVSDTTLTLTISTGSVGVINNNTQILVENIVYDITKFLFLDDKLTTKIWLSLADK